MRKAIKFIIAFVFSAFFAGSALAQEHTQSQPAQPQSPPQGWYQQHSTAIGNSGAIFFINRDTGWVTFGDGLFKTLDGGDTWIFLLPPPVYIYYFADPNNGWGQNDTALLRTSDGGKNWQVVSCPFTGQMQVFGMDTIYIFNPIREIFTRSNDGGKSWQNAQIVGPSPTAMSFANSKFGFIGGALTAWFGNFPPQKGTFGANFSVTIDGGITWTQKYCSLQEDFYHIYALNPNTLFANGSSTLARSTNGGIKWDTVGVAAANDFFFINNQSGYIADGLGIIRFTNDSGKAWIIQNSPVLTDQLNSIYFVDSLNGWAAGNKGVILHTIDGGNSWVRQYLPLPLEVRAIPEPFATKTTLSYSIPKAASVDLKLYDVLGKEVYHITSDGIQSEGAHSIVIDGGHLPGGVYYFILTAGEFNGMGKVTKIAP